MIRCKVCDEGELTRKRIYRFDWLAVTLGYLMFVGALAGTGLSLVLFGDEQAFPGVGREIGFLIIAGCSAQSFLVAAILTGKRWVLHCPNCGAVIPASETKSDMSVRFLSGD